MKLCRSLELMKKYTFCPECGWEVKIEEGDPRPEANDTTE